MALLSQPLQFGGEGQEGEEEEEESIQYRDKFIVIPVYMLLPPSTLPLPVPAAIYLLA